MNKINIKDAAASVGEEIKKGASVTADKAKLVATKTKDVAAASSMEALDQDGTGK